MDPSDWSFTASTLVDRIDLNLQGELIPLKHKHASPARDKRRF